MPDESGPRCRAVGHGRHARRLREALDDLAARHGAVARRHVVAGGAETRWWAPTWPARSCCSSTTSAYHATPRGWRTPERSPSDRTAELFAGGLPWRPGALEALRLVDGLGWPTALVTNTGRGAHRGRRWTASVASTSRSACAPTRCPAASPIPIPTCARPSCSGWRLGGASPSRTRRTGRWRPSGRARPCSSCRVTCRCRRAGPGAAAVARRPDARRPAVLLRRDTRRARRVRPSTVSGDPLGSACGLPVGTASFLSAQDGRRVQQATGRAQSDRARPIRLEAVRGDEA